MPWKCVCGHYIDVYFDICQHCGRPKPGTVSPDKMEYKLIFDYIESDKHHCVEMSVKGPISITTDAEHKRLYVKSLSKNDMFSEYSFDWTNSIAHGKPIQVTPIQEGGFDVNSSNEQLMINGEMPGATKTKLPITALLSLSSTMLIRLVDNIHPSFIKDALTPVGKTIPDGISPEILSKFGDVYYFNGLNEFYSSLYESAGVKCIRSSTGDLAYINNMILSNHGLKLRDRKNELARLKG